MTVPVVSPDLRVWAETLRRYLALTRSQLAALTSGTASAGDDGTLLWDRENKYPVVSIDGEWRQLVVANGFAFLTQDNDVTAAASDTGYAIVFDAPPSGYADGISLGASPNQSRIIFEEGGLYYLTFTAQIFSTNSSQADFYFWPKLNGTDVPEGATLASTHNNGQTMPITKGAIFSVSAGDYLEAYWATDSHTDSYLKAFAATAFAPAAPSVSLSITRIRA